MDPTNPSKEDIVPLPAEDLRCTVRRGGSGDAFSRIKSRLLAILSFVLLAFLFSNATMVKPYILSLAAGLASLHGGVCSSPTAVQNNLPAFKHEEKPWPSQKYVTESFKAPDMLINKTGKTEDGYLFINPWGNGIEAIGPAIMTEHNDLIWHGPSSDTTNLRVQSLDGKQVLTYWNGTSTATFGHAYGSVAILDDTYTEIGRICMKDLHIVTPGDEKFPCHLDMHESYITDEGTLIFTTYNVTKYDLRPIGGPKNGWIFDSLFFEVDRNEKVLFKWSALDHMGDIPLNRTHQPLKSNGVKYGYKQSLPFDYFHINSVQKLEDGYLVDGRQVFSFFKLNKKGDVEWTMHGLDGGDFTKPKDLRFSWQHHPRVKARHGNQMQITLFNNDNSQFHNGTHQSTGVQFTLDMDAMHATLDRRLVDPALEIYSMSQGSYQVLPNGHALLGYGDFAVVKEFNGQGEAVYTARFGESSLAERVASYRAYRYPWRATPKADPKVVARGSGDMTNVFISWNGATDVDHWTVLAGNSKTYLSEMRTVRRSGFETVVPLEHKVKYVQVEAKRGADRIRKSPVVKVKPLNG